MLHNQKHLFSIPDDIAYLNCAYMSPLLKSVEQAGYEGVRRKSRPYEIEPPHFFEPVQHLRQAFAQLVNAPDPNRIAVIPSASYGLATAARNLKLEAGDNIVLLEEQFPSNFYTWQRLAEERGAELRIVPAPDGEQRSQQWNERILAAIDERTALVTLGHIHWADGALFDLKAIRQRATEAGAWLVVDGTQSVGALPFDVQDIQPDALICAGYKWLLGPYSIGLAYFGPAFDGGVPIEESWINRLHSEDFKNLVNYQPAYQPLAGRYSMGEQSNFILLPMQLRALQQLLEWGVPNIQAYCRELMREPLQQLAELGCRVEPEARRAHHLVGVRLPEEVDLEQLKSAFQEQGVYVSLRGSAVRISCHVFNDERDVERLVESFKQVLQTRTG
ncbi:MAG: aminotransferase class V-fold PLP-dependent enzyme [Lewinellaceae bacterium]|nr:aminotransferase class V-fold PLP-dependent enzyme [Phaeodactylibacter sp.]MCB9039031.1 aminotransferase class V-fold PLP-dependent enzyme [Lewinellaceae bacterium]